MQLKEYLKVHGITHEKFAQMIEVTRPLVTNIANHKINPSIVVIVQIEKATDGLVSAQDLFNPDLPSKTRKRGRKPRAKV